MKQLNTIQTTREIVLIDIENLAGTGDLTACDVISIKGELNGVVADLCDLQCVVACSHHSAQEVLFAYPSSLRRIRSGRDGADLMLLKELRDHRVMARYGKVTLCSGDGIFADEVAALGRMGIEVTVIAREGSISARLRLAAKNVVLLPTHYEDAAEVLKVAS